MPDTTDAQFPAVSAVFASVFSIIVALVLFKALWYSSARPGSEAWMSVSGSAFGLGLPWSVLLGPLSPRGNPSGPAQGLATVAVSLAGAGINAVLFWVAASRGSAVNRNPKVRVLVRWLAAGLALVAVPALLFMLLA